MTRLYCIRACLCLYVALVCCIKGNTAGSQIINKWFDLDFLSVCKNVSVVMLLNFERIQEMAG